MALRMHQSCKCLHSHPSVMSGHCLAAVLVQVHRASWPSQTVLAELRGHACLPATLQLPLRGMLMPQPLTEDELASRTPRVSGSTVLDTSDAASWMKQVLANMPTLSLLQHAHHLRCHLQLPGSGNLHGSQPTQPGSKAHLFTSTSSVDYDALETHSNAPFMGPQLESFQRATAGFMVGACLLSAVTTGRA